MTQLGTGAQNPKRFYERAEAVEVDGGFEVQLDGRVAKTPKRVRLATHNAALADAVAQEWSDVEGEIDTNHMPLTKLLATVIDLGEIERATWATTITDYLQSDLLCYRASEPAALVARQNESWDPPLEQWKDAFGVPLEVTTGVISVRQSDETVSAVSVYLNTLSTEQVLAVKNVSEMTGSAVLALNLVRGVTTPDTVFSISRLDEQFQEARWGVDAEAKEREEALKRSFDATVQFLMLLT